MIKKILLTDILFPSKYAKWRLVTTKSFIDHEAYDTDILVLNKVNHIVSIPCNFDYPELKSSHSLYKYDILIFNPKYNHINKWNDKDFDGTIFNKKYPGDYMLRLKKYRSTELNIKSYDAIYHIFLVCYVSFNKLYTYPPNQQFIHLYPGGGFPDVKLINSIDKNARIIATHYFTNEHLQKFPKNKFITVYCAPIFDKNYQLKHKKINNGTLKVCFTSLGVAQQKGTLTYIKIVNHFLNKYKNENVEFFSVGLVPDATNIKHFDPMAQYELDKFYYENIDIIFNLDTYVMFNGFPLGSEGMAQGSILFTTDPFDLNIKCGFNYGNEMVIINPENLDHIVDQIQYLNKNRNILNENSILIQNKTYELFNYQNTMGKIFKFIDDEIIMMNNHNNLIDHNKVIDECNRLLSIIPSYFIGSGNERKKFG